MITRRSKGEGSIFELDGKWAGRYIYEDPITGLLKRSQVSGSTKREVFTKPKALRERVGAGSPAKDDKVPLATFAVSWIEVTLSASDRKASTKTLYAGLARVCRDAGVPVMLANRDRRARARTKNGDHDG